MKVLSSLRIAALFLGLLITGCSEKQTEKEAAKIYDLEGKIVAILSDKTGVTLDHEDIPGLMKGMKMDFPVKDAKLLEGLQVGDQVQGKLQVESGKYLITELKKR
jgi:protein SCO1/2